MELEHKDTKSVVFFLFIKKNYPFYSLSFLLSSRLIFVAITTSATATSATTTINTATTTTTVPLPPVFFHPEGRRFGPFGGEAHDFWGSGGRDGGPRRAELRVSHVSCSLAALHETHSMLNWSMDED